MREPTPNNNVKTKQKDFIIKKNKLFEIYRMKKVFSLMQQSKGRKMPLGDAIMNKAKTSALFFCLIASLFQQTIHAQANEDFSTENPANDFNSLFS